MLSIHFSEDRQFADPLNVKRWEVYALQHAYPYDGHAL